MSTSTTGTATEPSAFYVGGGVILAAAGLLWVLNGPVSSEVAFTPVEGISAFAALYVIAQVTERVTQFVIEMLSLWPKSPEKQKNEAYQAIRSANSTLNGNPGLDAFETAQTELNKNAEIIDVKRRDLAFLAQGLSIALAAVAVNALNYRVLGHIGISNVDEQFDRLVTVLVAAGGTKALHELIGRLQKSKEAAETAKAA